MIVIIELDEDDAYRVLYLIQRHRQMNFSSNGQIWDEYWANVADQIKECLKAQAKGKFFQCSACHQTERGIADHERKNLDLAA